MAWTTPGTAVAGDVLTAAFWNLQVRDNMNSILSSGKLFHVSAEFASGVSGGAATTGAWRQRPLNTTKTNTISGASLSSNQAILPSGTYFTNFWGNFFAGTAECENRLYNITDSSLILKSSAGYITGNNQIAPSGAGIFTIASSKTLELQYRVQTTVGSYGLGITNNWSESSVQAELIFWKVS